MFSIIRLDRFFFKEGKHFNQAGGARGKKILTKMTFGIDAGVTGM